MNFQSPVDRVRKSDYRDSLFYWIEKDNTSKVIEFFENYPEFVNRLCAPNNWSPLMYAVRYGNFELVRYFLEKGHAMYVPNIYSNTLVHAACYGSNPEMLTYLLGELKMDPNPPNGDPSPLKYCIKASNARLLEILTHYGAYYIFDDVYNNVEKKVQSEPIQDEGTQTYVSLLTGK